MVLRTESMIEHRRSSLTQISPPVKSSKWWPFSSSQKLLKNPYYGSHVAVQKLRESKWFKEDEERLFCAVVESGFVLEMINDSLIEGKSSYGVVSVEPKKDKKPTAKETFIYTIIFDDRIKVVKMNLLGLWEKGYRLRINNMHDNTKPANSDKDIKSQIAYAIKTKMNFQNSFHFADWCRYGDKVEVRKRQLSESIKWGTVGMNAGIFLVKQREKSNSFSK